MPQDIFAISAKETATKLDGSRSGTLSFSVGNKLERQVKVGASVEPEENAKREWLTVQPEIQILQPRDTKQFQVRIQVPPEVPAGSYRVHLVVVDDDKRDDYVSIGPAASFEVPAVVVPAPAPWRKWLLIGIAAVVVLGAGGYGLCRAVGPCGAPKGGQLHDSCKMAEPASACATGLKCWALASESFECRYEPASKCKVDSECTSFWCKGGICTRDDGVCTADADCRGDAFTCSQGKCMFKNGQACKDAQLCAGGFCNDGKCSSDKPCTKVCAAPSVCRFNADGTPFCALWIPPGGFHFEIKKAPAVMLQRAP